MLVSEPNHWAPTGQRERGPHRNRATDFPPHSRWKPSASTIPISSSASPRSSYVLPCPLGSRYHQRPDSRAREHDVRRCLMLRTTPSRGSGNDVRAPPEFLSWGGDECDHPPGGARTRGPSSATNPTPAPEPLHAHRACFQSAGTEKPLRTRLSQVRRTVLAPAFCFDNRRTRHAHKDALGFALVATGGHQKHRQSWADSWPTLHR
jgi:hypothetical protein